MMRGLIIAWSAVFTASYMSHLNGSISLGEFYDGMVGLTGAVLLIWFATVCIKRPIVLLYVVLIAVGSVWFGFAASLLTAVLVATIMVIMNKFN